MGVLCELLCDIVFLRVSCVGSPNFQDARSSLVACESGDSAFFCECNAGRGEEDDVHEEPPVLSPRDSALVNVCE